MAAAATGAPIGVAGLFGVVGGAMFQMWQTTGGSGSLTGAFQYFGSLSLVALFVAMPEPR